MAYKIINRLESLVTEKERIKAQLHKVFKDSFDAKAIIIHRFLLQKINYIHKNPMGGKWMLAKDFIGYEYSSASFYEIQLVKHHHPLHYLDLYQYQG